MQNSTNTNQFIDAMAELQFYMEESEKYKKEKEEKNTKKEKKKSKASDFESKDPIPRAESMRETNADGENKETSNQADKNNKHTEKKKEKKEEQEAEETAENKENGEDKEDKPGENGHEEKGSFIPAVTHFKRVTPAKYMGMPRYKEYDPAAPTVGVEAVKEAVKAMKELQMLQRNHYPFLLICMRDDGTRTQTRFRTLIQAQEQMEQEMQDYINQIEPIDANRVIYMDDGTGAHTYDPTPENELNPDGSFKHASEVDGTLHTLREETKGIVYFETQNATSRWDILNTDLAQIGDKPDDPEFEEFIRRAVEEAEEKKPAEEKETKEAKKSEKWQSKKWQKRTKREK